MAASLTAANNGAQSPATSPATILLVDDQPGRLLSYRAILEPLGENLIEARSGEEALGMLMENECALILSTGRSGRETGRGNEP